MDYQVKTHIAFSPNKVIMGFGSAAMVAGEVRYLRGKKVLLVTDPGVINAGLTQSIEASLRAENIPYVLYGEVEPEPPSKIIDRGAEIFKSGDCDLIVGVGGGSSLDVAKGISILTANEGRILDYIGVDTLVGIAFLYLLDFPANQYCSFHYFNAFRLSLAFIWIERVFSLQLLVSDLDRGHRFDLQLADNRQDVMIKHLAHSIRPFPVRDDPFSEE